MLSTFSYAALVTALISSTSLVQAKYECSTSLGTYYPYCINVPDGASDSDKLPTIVFLSGSGARGPASNVKSLVSCFVAFSIPRSFTFLYCTCGWFRMISGIEARLKTIYSLRIILSRYTVSAASIYGREVSHKSSIASTIPRLDDPDALVNHTASSISTILIRHFYPYHSRVNHSILTVSLLPYPFQQSGYDGFGKLINQYLSGNKGEAQTMAAEKFVTGEAAFFFHRLGHSCTYADNDIHFFPYVQSFPSHHKMTMVKKSDTGGPSTWIRSMTI